MDHCPKKYQVTIVKELWSCYDSKHKHTTEEIARKCMEKHLNPENPPPHKWTNDECMSFAIMHVNNGVSARAIGHRIGVSTSRAYQLVIRGIRAFRKLGKEPQCPA